MEDGLLRLGVTGCGGFGLFALQHFTQVSGVKLVGLFPGARLDVTASYGGNDRACRSRGKEIGAYQIVDLSWGDGQAKMPLYGRLLRSLMADQVAWIRDRNHRRVVTEANGRDSLAMACAADALAHRAGAER